MARFYRRGQVALDALIADGLLEPEDAIRVGIAVLGQSGHAGAVDPGADVAVGLVDLELDASYNGSIAPGGTTQIGLQGTGTSSDTAPTSFSLNGQVDRPIIIRSRR